MKKSIYIAGPMSGLPQFNFPAFFAAEERLKAEGWHVFNPANKGGESFALETYRKGDHVAAVREGFDFKEAFLWDVDKVINSDAIYMLHGWAGSDGASAEHAVACAVRKHYPDYQIIYEKYVQPSRAERNNGAVAANGAAQPSTREPIDVRKHTIQLKPTNPKDGVGIRKASMSCISAPFLMALGTAMAEGALKYGRHNYRAAGVRSSVYYDAIWRHVAAWWEGEDIDPESGMPHIVKAAACLAVLYDSYLYGNLNDDRPPKYMDGWQEQFNKAVSALLDKYPEPVLPFTERDRTWALPSR